MGKTIAFWAMEKEYGDVTRVMAAVAGRLGITEGYKVAVTALPGQQSEFLELFSVRIPERIRHGKDSNAGFFSLLQKALYEKPTEKVIMDSGIRTINKGPLLFPWFDEDASLLTEKSAVTLMLGGLKECFDFVLVDAGYGEMAEYGELLLKNADTVVVLLPQDKRKWKTYFDKGHVGGLGKLVYVMYPYLKDSGYSEKWFYYHYSGAKCFGLPLYGAFSDACADGRVAELFLETARDKRLSDNYFFASLKRLTEGVKGKWDGLMF